MPGTPEDSALGFDVGTRVIGVAIGNRLSGSSRALTTIAPDDWTRIDALVADWRPDALVVGLPLTLAGAEQPMSKRARAFATQLEQRYRRPVHLVDERNSSREAARRFALQRANGSARRKDAAEIDALAAAIILEAWL